MFNLRGASHSSVAAIAVILAANTAAYGVGWFDDFNDGDAEDGNPLTWTPVVNFLPGTYDASSGDYALSAPGDAAPGVNDPDDNSLLAIVNDFTFEDTYVRTQAVVVPGENPEDIGGNVGVAFRFNPDIFSGYAAFIDHNAGLFVIRSDFGVITTLEPSGQVPGSLSALNDIVLEVNMVLDEIEVFVWDPADEKPDTPIATIIDPDYGDYTSGKAGIVYNEDDDNTTGLFRWAAAQDTPFVDDELPADFNKDGMVDGEDFLIWQASFNTFDGNATPNDGDANGDGNVDGNDFLIWQASFGTGSGAGGGSVPEPTSAIIACLGLLAVAATRGRGTR